MANRRVTSNSGRENNVLSKQMIVLIGSSSILAPFQGAKLLVKQQVERGRFAARWRGPCIGATRAPESGQDKMIRGAYIPYYCENFIRSSASKETLMGAS